MAILITGGTGKTGIALAKLLLAATQDVLIASRSGKAPEPFTAVKFDWFNKSTFEIPFTVADIDRVYLVGPQVYDMLEHVKPFIDLALSKGVKQFVLLSATQLEPRDPAMGKIHQEMLDAGVEYAVLRPTWFIQNFSTNFLHSIRESNEILSAAESGRIPFVSIDDIAAAAFEALTVSTGDYMIVGPELYSYDEVAELLTNILGRKITHRRLSHDELVAMFMGFGLSTEYANMLAAMEVNVAKRDEEKIFKSADGRKYVGKHTLTKYLQDNRGEWVKE